METEEKLEAFKECLSFIISPDIKKFAKRGIEIMPDYFFQIPASSSGKYHPEYAVGEGGLLRHTVSAVRVGVELSRLNWWGFSTEDMDLNFTSIILHDGWKLGLGENTDTVFDHPTVASFVISTNSDIMSILPEEKSKIILESIESHMGQWNERGGIILPLPKTRHQKFVHLCDYLASRKCLVMDFDAPLSKK